MKVLKPAIIALLVGSCAPVPQEVFDTPPQNPQFMTAIQDPYFNRIDVGSFADVKVPYWQGTINGEPRYANISFGQQLVMELVLNRPPDFEFEKLTLTQFEGTCEPSRFISPNLLCELNYKVLLVQDGWVQELAGTIIHKDSVMYVSTSCSIVQPVCQRIVSLIFEQVAPIATKLRQQVYSS